MCNCAKFIAIEQQSEGICCCSSPLPPLPLLPLLLCSSRTVNKNRLHVKLCLASVKRSSTIDSNRPEHDVASVPPASTSLPWNHTLPHSAQLVLQFCMPFGYTFWLALFAPPLSFWPSPFSFYFLALLLLFFYFLHIFLAFMFFGRCCLVVRPALNK